LVPPLANFADGPSGVTYNPGTGLPAEYDRHFLMADFKGSPARSLVFSFALEPKGASFEVVNLKPFVSGILATDVEFGMDGAVYISDWVEGWGKTGKGRIYRIYHPESRSHPLVSQTREIVEKGFENLSGKELVELLAWPDQRVRQEAQFELAARGNDSIPLFSQVASSSAHQLARLHAIWGLGQIHSELRKQEQGAANAAIEPVAALLEDADAEVRAQSARVLGDARHSSAVNSLGRLATDTNAPRVQFFAAMALGKIGDEQGAQPILEMLRLNADKDAYLRHAGVMALYHLNNADLLKTAVQDPSPAVRMAALLVYRRQASPGISVFLRDLEPRLVLEAARAIYDLPIADAVPQLASLIHEPVDSEPLLRRVVNANFRLGTANSASALAAFAADSSKLNSARVEALLSLEDWEKPKGRDRITGLWRPLAVRPAESAADELRPILPQLLRDSSDEIQVVAARLAGKHEIREATGALAALAQSEQANSAARSEALRSLAVLKHPELPDLLEKAGLSEDEQLRQETIALWARLDPRAGAERLVNRLESGTVREQQAALLALAGLEAPGLNQVFLDWLDKLLSGRLDPALHLELLEAAYSRKSPALEEKLEQFEQSRPEDETGAYIETLFGGNALHGRTLFFESAEASCVRCHQIDGIGGEAGPALDQPNLSRSREHLLESLVAPNRNITPGFETVILRLADGAVYTGIVQSETETNLVLISPEDGPITLVKSEIESRERGGSGMPEGLGEILAKRDLRDLIEFLARLE
jgi:quinoprotein glucose dehydrogenase